MPKKPADFTIQPSHVKVFDFIKSFIDKNIYSPHLKEIAEATGLTVRTVLRITDDLVELQYISKQPFKQRGLRIIRDIRSH